MLIIEGLRLSVSMSYFRTKQTFRGSWLYRGCERRREALVRFLGAKELEENISEIDTRIQYMNSD